MGWIAKLRARAAAQPKTKLDVWAQRHREFVLRLPRWLVGTSLISSLALGVWCAIYDRGLMPLLRHLYSRELASLATVVLTTLPCMLVLYGIARLVRPRPTSNLPDARLRR
jgi:hypothetical protein